MTKLSVVLLALFFVTMPAQAETKTILALGDSLTAGLGLDPAKAFPARLEAELKATGQDVVIMNAGVSGDTTAQAAARLEWALTDEVDAVIVALGANDALRGLPPEQAATALDEILGKLKTRNLPTLVLGMRSPPNLGPDYAAKFEAMFPSMTTKHGAALYPFFLEGVAADPKLNQADGMHPNAAGVDEIVTRVLPAVEALLAKVK